MTTYYIQPAESVMVRELTLHDIFPYAGIPIELSETDIAAFNWAVRIFAEWQERLGKVVADAIAEADKAEAEGKS